MYPRFRGPRVPTNHAGRNPQQPTRDSLDDFALKLLGAPPLADALEAVAVAAVGQDAEAPLAGVGLLEHHLHAHAAHHVLAALDGERDLHVLLVRLDAGLERERGGTMRPGSTDTFWERQPQEEKKGKLVSIAL